MAGVRARVPKPALDAYVAAMRDRLVFLARELELPRGDDAVARDLVGR